MKYHRTKTLIVILLVSLASLAKAGWEQEQPKIDFLISEIAKLEASFIRNGSAHSAKDAADHLRLKLNNAQKSWFAPSKEKWTVDMFIEKIATKSSLSGTLYKIKFKDGTETPSGEWLKKKLESYKVAPQPSKGKARPDK